MSINAKAMNCKGILLMLALSSVTSTVAFTKKNIAKTVLDNTKTEFGIDTRIHVYEVSAATTDGSYFELTGKADIEMKKLILEQMKKNGVAVVDKIVTLPDTSVTQPWALVTISVASIRKEPRNSAELVSQAIMGTPVKVLEENNGMARIQTPDKYLGYVTTSSLAFIAPEQFDVWRQAKRMIVTAEDCLLYEKPEANPAYRVSDLTMGNLLVYKKDAGKFVKLQLPDGREGYAKKTDIKDFASWSQQTFEMATIERTARQMMGAPYLWGGMSTKMADCSGFVRTIYFSNGIILQRDASQQAQTGKKVDVKQWEKEAQPGDLIFTGSKSGRVTHVAMYLGNGKFIHSSGRVKINSINPKDKDYLNYVYLSISRIKGEVGTNGISAVKDHPWYFIDVR